MSKFKYKKPFPISNKEMMAYGRIKYLYDNSEYNESLDVLLNYMESYVKFRCEYGGASIMAKDEVENLLGLNTHEEIVEYILKY